MARAMIDVPGDIVSLSVSGNPSDWAKARERVVGITLAALTEAGFAIVPREPTPGMIEEGMRVECGSGSFVLADAVAASYRAMLATAPQP
jgi:hypothetical protein